MSEERLEEIRRAATETPTGKVWAEAVIELLSELDRLRAALAAGDKDTKRLDWLETAANEPGGLLLHDGSESGRCGLGLRPGGLVRTLREAIDSASARRDFLKSFIAARTGR